MLQKINKLLVRFCSLFQICATVLVSWDKCFQKKIALISLVLWATFLIRQALSTSTQILLNLPIWNKMKRKLKKKILILNQLKQSITARSLSINLCLSHLFSPLWVTYVWIRFFELILHLIRLVFFHKSYLLLRMILLQRNLIGKIIYSKLCNF
jgi:hypothetical protein